MTTTTYLRDIWHTLAGQYTQNREAGDNCFSEILENHSAPNRFYHNTDHIENLLHLIHEFRELLADPAALCFAAFYHDIIYDPTRRDNEHQSAQLAQRRLTQLKAPTQTIDWVTALIRATQTHTLTAEIDNFDNIDGAFFLDIDLAILGAPCETYNTYASAIRKEYAHVPDDVYARERKKVLQHFLDRDAIYRTAPLNERFGEQAVKNMRKEGEQL
ncbi:MAG: hypothetical protein GY765_42685 [bacterium]|nr:hypothetical protein [bacterium]